MTTFSEQVVDAIDSMIATASLAVSDETILHAIIHGPSTGPYSIVTTDNGPVKTVARVIAELGGSVATTAAATSYSPTTSGLAATNVQTAIDEVEGRVDTDESNITSALSQLNTAQLDIVANTADIATLQTDVTNVVQFGYATNSTRLNTSCTPGATTQAVRVGPLSLVAGDVLICSAHTEVTQNQGDAQNVLVSDSLFISTSSSALSGTLNADIVGGPYAGYNATNITPAQHHLVLQINGTLTVAITGSYYLIHAITWDGDPGIVAGTLENLTNVSVIRLRGAIAAA